MKSKNLFLASTLSVLFIFVFICAMIGGPDEFSEGERRLVYAFEWITTYIVPWGILLLLYKIYKK
ncbi:hypothetical protein [Paenibacillus montanisoli]|uniref:Uncharacterized protein n=1 Tax=Paenibacillus montanisoli TaxID=2081970 RepID=A0A328TVR0_9BACL|nr:hypothetical protein [Paenibacillus montanisoli]RAP73722.1 hypothetical protein DL346_26015 [Paenibacillus montanisoli]